MNIGIISAMSVEMKLIKESIDIIEVKNYVGFEFIVGKFKDLNVVLTTCSVGKVNAACCTQILIDKFDVTEIINTGIAGSLNNNVKICDVVISDDVTYHDVRQAQMKRNFPFKEFFTASERLKTLAIEAYKMVGLKQHNYHIGRIVTGEAFVSETSLKDVIINNYSPYCVEMEGGAIGHVAEINNIPFVIIRSISDNADDDARVNYDDFEAIASNNSATIVLKMLDIINSEIGINSIHYKKEICAHGDRVTLEFATLEDKKLIYDMLVSPEVIDSMFDEKHPSPTWEEFDEGELETFFQGSSCIEGSYLLIRYNEEIVGSISYAINNSRTKHAELDIWISSKKYIGHGLGTEAINLLMSYVTINYEIKTFIIRPWIKNINAIKAYKKCGFKEIEDFKPEDYYNEDELEDYGDGDYGKEETVNLIKVYTT